MQERFNNSDLQIFSYMHRKGGKYKETTQKIQFSTRGNNSLVFPQGEITLW